MEAVSPKLKELESYKKIPDPVSVDPPPPAPPAPPPAPPPHWGQPPPAPPPPPPAGPPPGCAISIGHAQTQAENSAMQESRTQSNGPDAVPSVQPTYSFVHVWTHCAWRFPFRRSQKIPWHCC